MEFLEELKGLKTVSEVSFYSSIVVVPVSFAFSLITGSGTLLIYFFWAVAAIIVKLFALISIRIMMKENKFMFPYGPGKLENFSSFSFGLSIVPFAVYYLVISVIKVFNPTPGITYLLCLVPVAITFTLSFLLTRWTRKMIRRTPNPSPLLIAYHTNFKVSLISDTFLLLAFFSGHLLSVKGWYFLSNRVDPVLSVILSLYMLKVGIPLIIRNIRSLIDLPLPEKDMLKILKVIAEFVEDYAGFGMLYSRQSGKTRFIEIELFFNPGISLEKISRVEQDIGDRMNQEIGEVQFRIIPRLIAGGVDA